MHLAGHIGKPGEAIITKNFVRLRDAETGEILQQATPPRNNTAQRIQWSLDDHAGPGIVNGSTPQGRRS